MGKWSNNMVVYTRLFDTLRVHLFILRVMQHKELLTQLEQLKSMSRFCGRIMTYMLCGLVSKYSSTSLNIKSLKNYSILFSTAIDNTTTFNLCSYEILLTCQKRMVGLRKLPKIPLVQSKINEVLHGGLLPCQLSLMFCLRPFSDLNKHSVWNSRSIYILKNTGAAAVAALIGK